MSYRRPKDPTVMRHLRIVSLLITAAGILTVVVASAVDAGATWVLAGLLLAWAGVVKIVVVALWQRTAGLGGPARTTSPEE